MDFGVEIECLAPDNESTRQRLVTWLEAVGIEAYAPSYNHETSHRWKIVTDNSLSGGRGGQGMELVSPPFIGVVQAERGFEQIHKICRVLKTKNFGVDKSCGLHVHIGVRGLSTNALKRLMLFYIENEGIIDSFLPLSRRGASNVYCKSLARANKRDIITARDITALARTVGANYSREPDKHMKLSYAAFWRQGTAEFRHHSGTIDPVKIARWVKLCDKMVRAAIRDQDVPLEVGVSPRPTGRHQMYYDLISRESGITESEANLEAGHNVHLLPNLRRAGIAYAVIGRRGGRRVIKLQTTVVNTPNTVATFTSFADQLALDDEERGYWQNRAAILAGVLGEQAAVAMAS